MMGLSLLIDAALVHKIPFNSSGFADATRNISRVQGENFLLPVLCCGVGYDQVFFLIQRKTVQ